MSLSHLYLCRPLYESSLTDELKDRFGAPQVRVLGSGYVEVSGDLPDGPLIFERQRMPRCRKLPLEQCKPVSPEAACRLLDELISQPEPWALWTFTQEESKNRLPVQVEGAAREILRHATRACPALKALERKPEKLVAQNRGKILQLFVCDDGLYASIASPAELTASTPGGVMRMRFDDGAPSRSYLKVEEALALLEMQAQPGQKVIDLGAAPGGWTYSFAKRGCHVLSIDNGPMKIKGEYSGTVTHRRRDGLTFQPEKSDIPVDWLVADMLVPPAKAVELLKRWSSNGWCRNVIINVKLPQQNPYAGLLGLTRWLRECKHKNLQARQLYHDRQEITVFGSL